MVLITIYILLLRVNLHLYIILVVVASVGIFLASVFLGINLKYRNERSIKMSSPNMNNVRFSSVE